VLASNRCSHVSEDHESADVKRRWCGGRAFFVASLLAIFSVFLVFALIIPAWAVPTVTYHGRILRPTGEPLHRNVAFWIQVLAPEGSDCVLYEETQTVFVSNGIFSLKIGEGNREDSVPHLSEVFQSGKILNGLSSCSGPLKLDLNSSRRLRVYFRDLGVAGAQWEEISATSINFVPLAIESKSVGGFSAKDLLRVEGLSENEEVRAFSKQKFDALENFVEQLVSGLTIGSGSGTVTEVQVAAPLQVSNPSTTPVISMPAAGPSQDGYLRSEDWAAFNNKQPQGNYIEGLTGDIEATGPGLANATIKDGVVTYSKIQQVGGKKLLGNPGGSAGSVQEIEVGSGLDLSNGVLSVANNGPVSVTQISSANGYLAVGGSATEPVLELKVGTTAGTVAAGDDPRIVNAVQRSGDTMTGKLYLREDGLQIADDQLVMSNGKIGLGVLSPIARLDVAGSIKIADGGENCSNAAHAGMIKYFNQALHFCDGVTWKTLGVSGSGVTSLNGLTNATQTLEVSTSGSALEFVSDPGSGKHTLHIPMASTATVTAGLISNADYQELKEKLSDSLPEGHIFVGDSSNKAATVAVSGDLEFDSVTGAFRVKGIRERTVSALPPQDGQVLKFDAGTNTWAPSNVSVSDLKTVGGVSQFAAASCSAEQTLSWSSATDQFICQNIEISKSQITDLGTLGSMASEEKEDYLAKANNL